MITTLLKFSNQIKTQTIPSYKRFLYTHIDFKERLIGLMGARGTGKTTLLLQYLKEQTNTKETLYIIGDHPIVANQGIFAIADAFQKIGGKVLIIDEIHKVKDFEIALKLVYDSFFELQIIFTGSSAVALDHAKADLSRRAMMYTLPVLSFREYLELETPDIFPSYILNEILENHTQIAIDILQKTKPLAYFDTYVNEGAYPFYKDGKGSYIPKLLTATMQVLSTDLPSIYAIEHDKINALKKMLIMICQSEPFDINISKLCGAVELNQKTLYKYMGILQSAGLIRILGAKSSGISIISKPEKLYLNNTNLFNIFCDTPKNGTIRETFFASALSYTHTLSYPKNGGDFMVDNTYTFEVGGRNKTKKQIKEIEKSFVVSDDMEIGTDNKIPLWLFGFLY